MKWGISLIPLICLSLPSPDNSRPLSMVISSLMSLIRYGSHGHNKHYRETSSLTVLEAKISRSRCRFLKRYLLLADRRLSSPRVLTWSSCFACMGPDLLFFFFKSLLIMLQYCFCFTFWSFDHEARDLSSLTSDQTCTPCIGRWHLNHCTTTEVPWSPLLYFFFKFYLFIFIVWRLITSQYCSGFCHTLTRISHGYTCIPHPDPPSHLPLHLIPLGLPSAPGPSACLMHPTWAGDLFHPR